MAEQLLNPVLREAEFRRCERDLIYFLSEYWKVATVGVGYGKFNLYPYQVEDARDFQEVHEWARALIAWQAGGDVPDYDKARKLRQIRLKARQLGWTTLATGAVFWSVFFHDNTPWLIAAQGQEDASITMKTQIKAPYKHLPSWMRKRGPQVIQDGAEDFGFDNGSRVRVIPSTPSAGRGDAMFGALLDEAAFAESAAELFAAVDPMCYGPMFIFSTANGMGNFFHETWLDSQMSDSVWEGKFRSWRERPGRDADWYLQQQIKYRNKKHLLFQEYPSTPDEAFSKSGRLALPVDRIEENQSFYKAPERFSVAELIAQWDPWEEWRYSDIEQMFEAANLDPAKWGEQVELHVWRRPEVTRDEHGRLAYQPNYVIAADVAEGLEHGDYNTVAVIDTNTQEVVATLKDHMPLSTFDLLLEVLGYWYHTALIGPERNNHGMVPLVALQGRRYPRLFRMDFMAQIKTSDRSPRYGWHTGAATKPKLVADMADHLGDGIVQLHDERFLEEARTFLTTGKGGYEASDGNHDDLVMGVGIAIQLMLDVGQSPPLFYDPEPGPPTMGEVLQVLIEDDRPMGVALAGAIGQERQHRSKRSFRFTPV